MCFGQINDIAILWPIYTSLSATVKFAKSLNKQIHTYALQKHLAAFHFRWKRLVLLNLLSGEAQKDTTELGSNYGIPSSTLTSHYIPIYNSLRSTRCVDF